MCWGEAEGFDEVGDGLVPAAAGLLESTHTSVKPETWSGARVGTSGGVVAVCWGVEYGEEEGGADVELGQGE